MKTSSPYGPGMDVKTPPETITGQLSKNGSKAKARYPSGKPSLEPGGNANTGGAFKRAYTPGTSPSGS